MKKDTIYKDKVAFQNHQQKLISLGDIEESDDGNSEGSCSDSDEDLKMRMKFSSGILTRSFNFMRSQFENKRNEVIQNK
jgi:hypothetical protein